MNFMRKLIIATLVYSFGSRLTSHYKYREISTIYGLATTFAQMTDRVVKLSDLPAELDSYRSTHCHNGQNMKITNRSLLFKSITFPPLLSNNSVQMTDSIYKLTANIFN